MGEELEPVRGTVIVDPAAEMAAGLDQNIKQTVRAMKGLWAVLAEQLYRFHTAEMWRSLGHDTFEAYLADPELEGLERRWVFELIAMYRVLVVQNGVGVEQLGRLHVSKVREVLPAIRRQEVRLDEALSDVETLTRTDIELKYRGLASSTPGVPSTGTAVETGSEPEWRTCPHCGSTYRVRVSEAT